MAEAALAEEVEAGELDRLHEDHQADRTFHLFAELEVGVVRHLVVGLEGGGAVFQEGVTFGGKGVDLVLGVEVFDLEGVVHLAHFL